MDQLQIVLVQRTFRHLMPIGDTVAEVFYRRLFELEPSLRELFRSNMRDQGRKLMQMMAVAVQGLSNFEAVRPAVEDLGRRHATYGVHPEHYELVRQALLATVRIGLGESMTADVLTAWSEAYDLLASTMQQAAATSEA
jgi:hemoglobin-like flavoprotein